MVALLVDGFLSDNLLHCREFRALALCLPHLEPNPSTRSYLALSTAGGRRRRRRRRRCLLSDGSRGVGRKRKGFRVFASAKEEGGCLVGSLWFLMNLGLYCPARPKELSLICWVWLLAVWAVECDSPVFVRRRPDPEGGGRWWTGGEWRRRRRRSGGCCSCTGTCRERRGSTRRVSTSVLHAPLGRAAVGAAQARAHAHQRQVRILLFVTALSL